MLTYYKQENGKITEVCHFNDPIPVLDEGKVVGYKDDVNDYIKNTFILADKEIVQLVDGSYVFIDEVDFADEAVKKLQKDLEEAKERKLQEVDAWTASKIVGGFISTCYNGEPVLYDTDTDTQLTMTKARTNCLSDRFKEIFPSGMGVRGYVKVNENTDSTPVFDTNKTILLFTPEQIIAWDEDFSLHLNKCKGEGWVMQAEVKACTSLDELNKITL